MDTCICVKSCVCVCVCVRACVCVSGYSVQMRTSPEPVFQGKEVNKQDLEGKGGWLGTRSYLACSTLLYCKHHLPSQYTNCVKIYIKTLSILDLFC